MTRLFQWKTFCLLLVLTTLTGCNLGESGGGFQTYQPPPKKADDLSGLPATPPSRIILLIGDGMGVGAITGAAYANDGGLNMLGMPEAGFMATYNYEFISTDSAASATAMASGQKTSFEAVGVLPGTLEEQEDDPARHLETIIDVAQAADWRTGLIATTMVVDATPAGFGAHRSIRKNKEGIALDLSLSGIDVLLGGGLKYFEDRSDGANLISRMRNRGYSVARTATGLRRVSRYAHRVVGLLHEKDMPSKLSGERAMSLPEMTEMALRVLDQDNPDGFFLMVEGSQIDRRSHEVDGPGAIAETLDFDRAVGQALDYARGRDDTLVVVTADHETGGLIIFDPEAVQSQVDRLGGISVLPGLAEFPNYAYGPDPLEEVDLEGQRLLTSYGYLTLASRPYFTGLARYFNAPHTPSLVPVFAEGPGAEYVAGTRDNSDLGRRLKLLAAQDGETVDGAEEPEPDGEAVPANLILLVADGAGLPTMTSAFLSDARMSALAMPVCGLLSTHPIDRLVNDNAGAASALAAGQPVAHGTLATTTTLLEQAEASGLLTGVVSNSSLTSPSLAAFYAHHHDPGDREQLGRALADFGLGSGTDGIDLAFGGGLDHFVADTLDDWRLRGALVQTDWSDDPAESGEQLIRIIASGDLDPASARKIPGSDQPTLEDMTWTALESLQDRGDGFVLIVHAGGIDSAASALERGRGLIDEVVDFDGAVRAAHRFAEQRGDTAVVVTATRDSSLSLMDNHYGFHKGHCGVAQRCGGPVQFADLPAAITQLPHSQGLSDTLLQGDYAPPTVLIQYAWISMQAGELPGPQSANFVPLFATGPGSSSLKAFHSQDQAGSTILRWLIR